MSTRKLPPEHLSDELPTSMGKPANAGLVAHGIRTLDDVARHSKQELLAIHGVGPKAIRILGEVLAERGLGFR